MSIPMIGICRHRLVTDGQGVTTLVAFHGYLDGHLRIAGEVFARGDRLDGAAH